jgi:hypothetical protein
MGVKFDFGKKGIFPKIPILENLSLFYFIPFFKQFFFIEFPKIFDPDYCQKI